MPRSATPRRSLVTGANRGLGLEFVRQLLARGDHVIAACRHPGKATALNQLAGEHPGRLHVLPLDVADEKSRTAFAHELPLVTRRRRPADQQCRRAALGRTLGPRAGGACSKTAVRTNALGPFLLTQALASQLVDGGTVANMSSCMSSLSGDDPDFNAPSYRISKTALNMATADAGARRWRRASIKRGRAVSRLGADRHGRQRRADHARRNRWRDCCR